MIKVIRAEFRLRGTENEIERVKARLASLSACEEVISLYLREEDEGMSHKELFIQELKEKKQQI